VRTFRGATKIGWLSAAISTLAAVIAVSVVACAPDPQRGSEDVSGDVPVLLIEGDGFVEIRTNEYAADVRVHEGAPALRVAVDRPETGIVDLRVRASTGDPWLTCGIEFRDMIATSTGSGNCYVSLKLTSDRRTA
jgi:hypothetical protein